MSTIETDGRAPRLEPDENGPQQAAAASPDATAPDDAVEALTRETAELKDRLLRALAETENMRRRCERDVADARAYGISSFARDLLVVADNMRRALDSLEAAVRENEDPGIKALVDGVELTERELLNALDKHGVKRIDPMGTKFDPHRHQAMFELPDPSVPAGTVVQVVQPGYVLAERVLRPAMVGIAKGGPRAVAAENAASANDNPPPQ
jgi:molecular chaperone GrpE